jgi:hypothetical protein
MLLDVVWWIDDEAAWTRRKLRASFARGVAGVACMVLPFAAAIMLFIAGHPAGPPRQHLCSVDDQCEVCPNQLT